MSTILENTMMRRVLWMALLLLWSASTLSAAQNPIDNRGFNADGLYGFDGVDNVNTFNGSLNLNIPLGGEYTAGDRLKYRFSLAYNSGVWDLERRIGSSVRTETVPNRRSNAGMGFLLTLGELFYHDWLVYLAPDGSEHAFKSDHLHFGTDTATTDAVLYARDGSYIRVRKADAGGEVLRVVDMPDGLSREFVCVAACGPFANEQTRFQLRRIYDAFGNTVTIQRDAEPSGALGQTWTWTISEQTEAGLATTHYLTFEYYQYAPYRWIVQKLDLAVSPATFVSGQPISTPRRAVYTFEYYTGNEAQAYRSPLNTAFHSMLTVQPSTAAMWVPTLKSITLPDDSKWQFAYNQTVPDPAAKNPDDWNASADNLVNRVTYPTGGSVRYEWGSYTYPRRACFNPGERDSIPRAARSDGVVLRQLVNPDGTEEGKPWRYLQGATGGYTSGSGEVCLGFDTFINTVVDPLANVTVNHFTTVINTGTYGNPKEYGLPIDSRISDPLDGTRRLSTSTFKCASTDPFDPAKTPKAEILSNTIDPSQACGSALRETYVRYESSGETCDYADSDNGSPCTYANRRVASQRTVYVDDGNAWKQVEYTDFDGLGHYRQVTTSGNFWTKNAFTASRPHGDQKVSRTNYNPGVSFNLSAQTFCCAPAATANWILDLYDEISEEEPTTVTGEPAAKGGVARTEYLFDNRGFLLQKRTRAGASRSGDDLLTTYERVDDSAGRMRIKQRFYGGDNANLPTTALPINNPGSAGYAIEQTFRFGSLEKSEYKTCNTGTTVLLQVQNEIDPFTGAVMSSRDASGATTTYLYDTMQRLTEINPPGEAKTSFAYTNASSSGGATATATVQDSTTSFDPVSKWTYDGFGRVSSSSRRLSDLEGVSNRWSLSTQTYYPNGWLHERSTTGLAGTKNDGLETFTSYDPFGRVLEDVHADSTSTNVLKTTFTYAGARTRTAVVNGTATASGSITKKEFFDSQDRLAAVTENINGGVQTFYEYDSSNRLVKVSQGEQTRTFTYDNRGFLLKETHPELGSSGVSYGRYDARGNAHEVYYGSTSTREELDRSMTYDAAERLVLVSQPWRTMPDGKPAPLKSFTYYQRSDGDVYQLGLLKKTQRHNYVYDPAAVSVPKDIVITESYQYWPSTRRLKSTTLASAGVKMITTHSYDNQGHLSSLDYPQLTNGCIISSTCFTSGPARTVQNTYAYGALSSVTGYLDTIGYHPNGLTALIKSANGAKWTQEVAAHNLPRPDRIRVDKGTRLWTSGFYAYDGAGNIIQIDADKFTYDEAGRLTKADMSAPAGTQTYSYDRYGNHKPFPGTTFSPETATNHLPSDVASYDVAGNVTRFKHPLQPKYEYRYEYDPFNMIRHETGWDSTSATKVQQVLGRMFLYNAYDERIATVDYLDAKPNVRETWSARDGGNRVIRDFQRLYDATKTPPSGRDPAARGWSWTRDYVFGPNGLAASVDASGPAYVHLDHLGSPRLTSGAVTSEVRIFRPFGEEAVSHADPIRLKFTGHERDIAGGDRLYGNLDYMHARYYNPLLGRFLSVDPGRDVDSSNPQSWNLYAYVRNSPIGSTDPTGRAAKGNQHEAGATAFWFEQCGGQGADMAAGCTAFEIMMANMRTWTDTQENKRKKRQQNEEAKHAASSNRGLEPNAKANHDNAPGVFDPRSPVGGALEDFSEQTLYFGNGFGKGFLGAGPLVNWIASHYDPDQERRYGLVNTDSAGYQVGEVSGVFASCNVEITGLWGFPTFSRFFKSAPPPVAGPPILIPGQELPRGPVIRPTADEIKIYGSPRLP